jgi:hypothetical protein
MTWTLNRAGWGECCELSEAVFKTQEPGHQYLSRERVDEVLVELAYREARSK